MPYKYRNTSQPSWLWFFLALPLGLIAVVVWQRRRVQALLNSQVRIVRRMRYVEPDSIPIDTRPGYDMADMEEANHEEHAFNISEADLFEARMNEVRFTAAPVEETESDIQGDSSPAQEQQIDDLEIIEGIGPKIAALLIQQGITTFRQLADSPQERLEEILIAANFRLANPGTWAEQAGLAAAGDLDSLQQLKDKLKAGRRKE
jgi:predicted flap endonuclease-1-like 5' DNA nuclease